MKNTTERNGKSMKDRGPEMEQTKLETKQCVFAIQRN